MSRFIRESDEYAGLDSPAADFESATRLMGGGSACDIFKTRWQRREVFIKRLKPEHRNNPLYLDALDKEFDIGIQLRHPSLPEYREFHRDYIIIDYIDGNSLEDLILKNDKWLLNKRNVTKILSQLVNVVEYLHFHNIVHSDIKPDNIMITSDSRNLILVDFDKCHTYSLDDTAGDPGLYGLPAELTGKTSLDFHGMAKVADAILSASPSIKDSRFARFINECRKPEPDFDSLRNILDRRHSLKRPLSIIAASLIAAMTTGGLMYVARQPVKTSETKPATVNASPLLTEDTALTDGGATDAGGHTSETKTEPMAETSINYKSQEKLHDEAAQKAALLDKRIQPLFSELLDGLDNLRQLKTDSCLTGSQLLAAIRKHDEKEEEYMTETFGILNESFPGITDREAWRILSHSKAYTGYKRRATPELREYGLEIERRGGVN